MDTPSSGIDHVGEESRRLADEVLFKNDPHGNPEAAIVIHAFIAATRGTPWARWT
jgi:hypothetical protein